MPAVSPVSAPLAIGPLQLASPLLLAPLAGYTDLPFRLLCREHGAALCFSEMISCHGLIHGQQNTLDMIRTLPAERPFGLQLFGGDPESMGQAAAKLASWPIDCLDINMGCPVRKVVKKGAGVALMRDLTRAEAMIRAVVARAGRPVTVKFRSGLDQRSLIAPEFAAMAEAAGVAAVIVHGRTWAQGFGGQADWKMIGMVKRAVSIPVIGNGDITSHAEALEMMVQAGCDGVMIGRGALGNPWVFDPQGRPPTLAQRMPAILRYLELAEAHHPGEGLIFRVKNQAVKFLGGLAGAAKLRQAINAAAGVAAIFDLLHAYVAQEARSID